MTPQLIAEAFAATLAIVAFGWVARSTIETDDLRHATRDRLVAGGRLLVTASLALWLVRETVRADAVPDSPWELALWLLWLPALAGYFFEYRSRLKD